MLPETVHMFMQGASDGVLIATVVCEQEAQNASDPTVKDALLNLAHKLQKLSGEYNKDASSGNTAPADITFLSTLLNGTTQSEVSVTGEGILVHQGTPLHDDIARAMARHGLSVGTIRRYSPCTICIGFNDGTGFWSWTVSVPRAASQDRMLIRRTLEMLQEYTDSRKAR